MNAEYMHCFSPHTQSMQNYEGQQTSRYHTDHACTRILLPRAFVL